LAVTARRGVLALRSPLDLAAARMAWASPGTDYGPVLSFISIMLKISFAARGGFVQTFAGICQHLRN
jgi:hypothetical protein